MVSFQGVEVFKRKLGAKNTLELTDSKIQRNRYIFTTST